MGSLTRIWPLDKPSILLRGYPLCLRKNLTQQKTAKLEGMSAPVEIPRKIWTRAEAHALVEAGIPHSGKWELIEGELIDQTGKKRPHVIWQHALHDWLRGVFGTERVESESPNDVASEDNLRSEPEPDLKVLRKASREYADNPQPETFCSWWRLPIQP